MVETYKFREDEWLNTYSYVNTGRSYYHRETLLCVKAGFRHCPGKLNSKFPPICLVLEPDQVSSVWFAFRGDHCQGQHYFALWFTIELEEFNA